jgi:long-chain acyl-CoA synthetase
MVAAAVGATTIIMEGFDAEEFLRLVERHRVTHTQLVPTMFVRLLKLPEAVRQRYDLSSLKTAVHAAAPACNPLGVVKRLHTPH